MDARIIESIRKQIPEFPDVDSKTMEVHFDPEADALIVYFTPEHTPTYWTELDDYLLLGRNVGSDAVTGVMVEYFSEWLLLATEMAQRSNSLLAA